MGGLGATQVVPLLSGEIVSPNYFFIYFISLRERRRERENECGQKQREREKHAFH